MRRRTNSLRGFTFYVVVGPYAGFGIKRERIDAGTMYRMVLGWIGFSIATFDAEQFIGIASRALTASSPSPERKESCVWTSEYDDPATYESECGKCYSHVDGEPLNDGESSFCQHCGGRIIWIERTSDDDDEAPSPEVTK